MRCRDKGVTTLAQKINEWDAPVPDKLTELEELIKQRFASLDEMWHPTIPKEEKSAPQLSKLRKHTIAINAKMEELKVKTKDLAKLADIGQVDAEGLSQLEREFELLDKQMAESNKVIDDAEGVLRLIPQELIKQLDLITEIRKSRNRVMQGLKRLSEITGAEWE